MNKNRLLALLVLIALAVTMPVAAQETAGAIAGRVTDTSEAVIPGVTVTIVNKGTDDTYEAQTGESGNYVVRNLAPGRYAVTFETDGFAKTEIPDVIVLLGKTVTLNAEMEVGQRTEIVQVTEAAPLIDTTSTMIAQNVTSEELEGLPKARSFESIALFAPSVNTGEIEGGYQVNGASAAENNYYIDGVSTASLIDGSSRQNAVFEYIQEVQVKTAGLEAEYGGALGGVVTAVTKSGGNGWHGEGHYYYYGNSIGSSPVKRLQLDPITENTFSYIQDDKQSNNNHEVGGSIGGPIVKNKLFVFASLSPRWQRRSRDYLFDNGETPGTMKRSAMAMSAFGKVSFLPTDRVRTHFSWLYTPRHLTGSLFSYNGMAPNVSTQSLETAQAMQYRGYNQPEQSLTGTVDITLTNTSLLSIKGGRYRLNYKDTGVPTSYYTWWRTSSVGLEGVPEDVQLPSGYQTPAAAQVMHDTTTRTYVQADYSHFFNFGGQHNLKVGIGTQKNVNNVDDMWNGPGGRVSLYWDREYQGQRGQYGFYLVEIGQTKGSAGAHITHTYVQDSWRVHPRLTLNLGIRMERETIPSFDRAAKDYAFRFGWGDKLAPRIGASYDVLGNGRLKISGAWGRFFDWTKYDLARGTFGGDNWLRWYRSLDTTDVFSLNLDNMPGDNLWPSGEVRNFRLGDLDALDPDVKPMSVDNMNIGIEYEIQPQTVFSARYVRNKLNRTIEDLAALDDQGNEVYGYGNPGEGMYVIGSVSGATCPVSTDGVCGFRVPKAERTYDAMELTLTRRFSQGWFASASYVYSRLWGNYTGLQNTDEIRPPTLGFGSGKNQGMGVNIYRPGGNANRAYDLDEIMFDANGNVGVYGPLPTDRPHVFKFYGSKQFKWGTEVGGFFRASSGTPMSTLMYTLNHIHVMVNGRGDMGRTPMYNQTDLMVAHEFSLGETKRLRLEFNMENLFNQKTAMYLYDRYNREERPSAQPDLSGTDLSKPYDWKGLIAASDDGADALDPRFGQNAVFNPGFQGRFLIKFIF